MKREDIKVIPWNTTEKMFAYLLHDYCVDMMEDWTVMLKVYMIHSYVECYSPRNEVAYQFELQLFDLFYATSFLIEIFYQSEQHHPLESPKAHDFD